MSRVIDLTTQRRGGGPSEPLQHPAGVTLPFEGPSDAALIIPEIRSEIRSGAYSAEMIRLLPEALEPGDRVLVIGAGLGILSTLIARREEVERIIAVEANTALVPYLERVHEANGAGRIETVNAVLAEGKKGRVPFFARRDIRTSSLLPHDRPWQQVMMVPFMDLNLILAEERISLVVCDIPVASAQLLARADLDPVERILLNCADDPDKAWADGGVCALLVARGYVPEPASSAVLFRRVRGGAGRRAAPGEAAGGEAGPEAEELETEEIETEEIETGEPEAEGLEPEEAATEEETPEAAPAEEEAPPEAEKETAPAGKIPGGDSRERMAPDAEASGAETHEPETLGREPRAAPSEEDLPWWERTGPGPGTAEESWERADRGAGGAPGTPGDWRRAETASRPGVELPGADLPGADLPGADLPGAELPGAGHGAPAGEPTGSPADSTPDSPPEPSPEEPDLRSRWLWRLVTLTLVLALPLMLIGEIASERAGSQSEAAQEIGAAWGGPQTLTGPFLLVPVDAAAGAARAAAAPLIVLPNRLEIVTELDTEIRERGLYEVLVYRSRNDFRIVAGPVEAALTAGLLAPGETPRWEDALLGLGIPEPQALRGDVELAGTGGPIPFQPGSGVDGLRGVHAAIGDPRGGNRDWRFTLELAGSRQLRVTPAARLAEWRLRSDWPHPDFAGGFPPAIREIGPGGFAAEWRVPQLAHGLPQAFRGADRLGELRSAAFGVNLTPPVDPYGSAERAAKTGLLFIVLTFGATFLIGRSARRPVRLKHYALIGAAQCAFFLLLLSLAERIGFHSAYAVSAGATIALLTGYAWAGLRLGPRAGWITLTLAVLYAAMFPVLLTREHALLMASVLAFAVLAALMWSTRNGTLREGGLHERSGGGSGHPA